MKRSFLLLLVIGVTIIFFGCSEGSFMTPEFDQSDQVTAHLKSDNKPSPNLTGTMDLYFDILAVPPGDPVWVGTIYFEGYGEYGMRFSHLSPFRDYSQAISPIRLRTVPLIIFSDMVSLGFPFSFFITQ